MTNSEQYIAPRLVAGAAPPVRQRRHARGGAGYFLVCCLTHPITHYLIIIILGICIYNTRKLQKWGICIYSTRKSQKWFTTRKKMIAARRAELLELQRAAWT